MAKNAVIADSFLSRMIGLLNRSSLSSGEALVITHCQSIHMMFMRFAIDVVFVDKNDEVIGLVEKIKPFCFSPIFFKSSYAVEFPAGAIARMNIEKGDKIQIK
jgi:hypothetical protein